MRILQFYFLGQITLTILLNLAFIQSRNLPSQFGHPSPSATLVPSTSTPSAFTQKLSPETASRWSGAYAPESLQVGRFKSSGSSEFAAATRCCSQEVSWSGKVNAAFEAITFTLMYKMCSWRQSFSSQIKCVLSLSKYYEGFRHFGPILVTNYINLNISINIPSKQSVLLTAYTQSLLVAQAFLNSWHLLR